MKKLGAARGICTHVFIHAQLNQIGWPNPFQPIYERVSAAARSQDTTVTHLFPTFRVRDSRRFKISDLDPHPKPEGHRPLADALNAGLQTLPAECWTKR